MESVKYELNGKTYEFMEDGIQYDNRIFLKYELLENISVLNNGYITFSYKDKPLKIPYPENQRRNISEVLANYFKTRKKEFLINSIEIKTQMAKNEPEMISKSTSPPEPQSVSEPTQIINTIPIEDDEFAGIDFSDDNNQNNIEEPKFKKTKKKSNGTLIAALVCVGLVVLTGVLVVLLIA